jgi:hypothetical protein
VIVRVGFLAFDTVTHRSTLGQQLFNQPSWSDEIPFLYQHLIHFRYKAGVLELFISFFPARSAALPFDLFALHR